MLKDEVCEDILLVAEPPRQDEEDDDDHVGADRAFPGLVGRNRRTHLMLAPGAAAEISADVCAPHDEEDRQNQYPAAGFVKPKQRQISRRHKDHRCRQAGEHVHLEAVIAVEEFRKEDHAPGHHHNAVHDEEEPVHLRERLRPIERKLRNHFNRCNERSRHRAQVPNAQPLIEHQPEADGHHSGKSQRTRPDGEPQNQEQYNCSGNAKLQHGCSLWSRR